MRDGVGGGKARMRSGSRGAVAGGCGRSGVEAGLVADGNPLPYNHNRRAADVGGLFIFLAVFAVVLRCFAVREGRAPLVPGPGSWSVFAEDVDVVELDGVECLFLVVDLEVDPELWCGAEGLGEAVGEWHGDGLFAVDDVGDGLQRHVDCGGHVVVVEVERLHEFFVEYFAGRAEVGVVGHGVFLSLFFCLYFKYSTRWVLVKQCVVFWRGLLFLVDHLHGIWLRHDDGLVVVPLCWVWLSGPVGQVQERRELGATSFPFLSRTMT